MRNGGLGQKWEPEEDRLLAYWQNKLGNKWAQVAKHIPDRTGQQCAQRWRHTNPSISKGKWTTEEDQQLSQLVDTCGVGHWAEIARHMAGRTDQQCLARWTRHLDPSINRGNWSEQEDAMLLQLYEQYGSNWSRMAKAMKVRIPHQCRSRFNVLARGSVNRSQSGASDSQQQQQQQKRRRKGAPYFARIGAAQCKKPKWVKADWEGESDSEDEGMYEETGDYYDEDLTTDNYRQDGDGFADDAEEAAALLTSFQRSADAAAAGRSSGTAVDTVDNRVHALSTEEEQQQQEQWQQQERQQQQHWERWQQRQKQQKHAVKADCITACEQDAAAAASAGFAYRSSTTAADVTQVLQAHMCKEVAAAAAAAATTVGRQGTSAASSKSSSSNILDIGRSSGDNSLGAIQSVPDPAEYSHAIAAAAAIADASSRNTSPEFVQQPVAPSGVGSSAAAAAAAAVAALLGSGGLTAGAATAARPTSSKSAAGAGNGSVDASALVAALSRYAAGAAALHGTAGAVAREVQAGAGYLSKTGSSAVPAVIADSSVVDPASAADDAGKRTAVLNGGTTAALNVAGAPGSIAAAVRSAGAFALGTGSAFGAAAAAAAGGGSGNIIANSAHAVQAGECETDVACATTAALTAPSSSQQLLLLWLKSETAEQAPPADPLPVLPLHLSCLAQQQAALQQKQQQSLAAAPRLQQLAALYAPYMPAQQQQFGTVVTSQQQQQPQSTLSQALQQLRNLPGMQQQQHELGALTAGAAGLSGSNSMDSEGAGKLNLVDMVRILAAAQPPPV